MQGLRRAKSPILAAVRLAGAGKALHSRILPEPLAVFPILAATPTTDAQWSATVAWAIYTLQRAEIPAAPWAAGGPPRPADQGAGTRSRGQLASPRRRRRRKLRRDLRAQSRGPFAAEAAARAERAVSGGRIVRRALSRIILRRAWARPPADEPRTRPPEARCSENRAPRPCADAVDEPPTIMERGLTVGRRWRRPSVGFGLIFALILAAAGGPPQRSRR